MSKQFMAILAAITIVFLGILFFGKKGANTPTSSNGDNSALLSQHVAGKLDSKVTFVEYGDFQCPACGGYFPIVRSIKEQYKDRVKFQFRHFPLSEIHQNALVAARAAEAASQQGKFWEMHDMLYENQQSWSVSTTPSTFFESYAKEIGLDVAKFQADAKNSKTNDIIQADRAEAKKQGYGSTPTFVINGRVVDNPPRDVEGFAKLLDEALKAE